MFKAIVHGMDDDCSLAVMESAHLPLALTKTELCFLIPAISNYPEGPENRPGQNGRRVTVETELKD